LEGVNRAFLAAAILSTYRMRYIYLQVLNMQRFCD
jgi:hypothetical protein